MICRFDRLTDEFLWLKEAGVAIPAYNVEEPKQPLILARRPNFFKLFMNDVGLLAALYMDGIQLKIPNGETDINFEALVFTDASFNRKGSLRYVPVYLVMFLEKEALPETMIYELPTL